MYIIPADLLQRNHAVACALIDLIHLLQTTLLITIDQIIRQQNRNVFLRMHQRRTAMYGMPQTQGFGLADINAIHMRRNDIAHDFQRLFFLFGFQLGFQLRIAIKVIGDCLFGASRNENQGVASGFDRFAHRIVNHRTIYHGEHFFRNGFSGRQKARTHTRHRKNGLT